MEKINFINGQAPALNGANLNQLQTNIENAINETTEYSTEVKKIGTTHNGKPIYRKFIELGYQLDTISSVSLSSLDVANVINIYGMTYGTDIEVPINFNNGTGSNSCYYSVGEKALYYKFSWGVMAHIYIDFTKTTD